MHRHLTLRTARALSFVVAALAVTWASVLAGCQGGRLVSRERGGAWLLTADAGATDAGRIVLMDDPDAGAGTDASVALPDAFVPGAPPADAAVAAPDAFYAAPDAFVAPPDAFVPSGGTHAVTLYGTSSCGACLAARAFLDGNDVAYTYRNLADPAVIDQLVAHAATVGYDLGGSVSMPVIVIDATMTEGWSESRARAQLGL
jgi:glutaredoxin